MVRKIFLYSSLFFFALAITGAATWGLIYNSQTLDASKLRNTTAYTHVFDDEGNKMEHRTSHGVEIEALPSHIKWAFICVEDKDFYKHNGVSLNRIAKAGYKNTVAGKTKEGASTISQQLIKNTHLSPEKTMKRKVREAALAIKLEKQYTKDEILEMYLMAVYFGNGCTGIEDAARFYYDKDVAKLSVREAAGLAGLLRSPGRFNPLASHENFTSRTNLVLHMMYTQGKITKAEYETARVEEVAIHGKRDGNSSGTYIAAAISQAGRLCKLTPQHRVFTFFEPQVQAVVDDVAMTPDYQIKTVSSNVADTMIIACTPNGHINALHTNNRLMVNARRNFASAMKPICVYAPAIERGVVTPETIIDDSPYVCGDFHPRNHDGKFRGSVTVRESLANSYNVPACKVLEYTGVEHAVDVARGLGLPLESENLALSLGVTQNGVSAMHLLGGFCAIANGGQKTAPSFVKRIEDGRGKTVWQYTEPYLDVLSQGTCLQITDILQDTVRVGTAKKMASLEFDIAAKTGTTERGSSHGTNTDAVNVSYTPERVLLVWKGNADMKPDNDLPQGTTGGSITSYIARDIQRDINTGAAKFGKYEPKSPAFVMTPKTGAKIALSGKTGATGAPTISFNVVADKKYSVFKTIGGETSLIEVVKPEVDGTYTMVDSTAPTQTVIEYHVTAGDVKSNVVKIYTAKDINRNTTQSKSKHWFF